MAEYLFKSRRLGFRAWANDDIPLLAQLNADMKVMEHFPSILNQEQTTLFVHSMMEKQTQKAYCYFATDRLDDGAFIGFIGLSDKNFEADFTPCVDIGWRLTTAAWGHGYATEGAIRCLEYAFNDLHLAEVYSIAPVVNEASVRVMQKAGMQKQLEFTHPQLLNDERLKNCALYKASKINWSRP